MLEQRFQQPTAGPAFAVGLLAQIERERSVLVLCPPQHRFNAKAYNPKRKGRRAWKWQRRRLMEQRFSYPLVRALPP